MTAWVESDGLFYSLMAQRSWGGYGFSWAWFLNIQWAVSARAAAISHGLTNTLNFYPSHLLTPPCSPKPYLMQRCFWDRPQLLWLWRRLHQCLSSALLLGNTQMGHRSEIRLRNGIRQWSKRNFVHTAPKRTLKIYAHIFKEHLSIFNIRLNTWKGDMISNTLIHIYQNLRAADCTHSSMENVCYTS